MHMYKSRISSFPLDTCGSQHSPREQQHSPREQHLALSFTRQGAFLSRAEKSLSLSDLTSLSMIISSCIHLKCDKNEPIYETETESWT